jgi:hypothetical protein
VVGLNGVRRTISQGASSIPPFSSIAAAREPRAYYSVRKFWRLSGVALAPSLRRARPISPYPGAADIVGNMHELADSGALARGPGAPRCRPVGDGSLFFRGLLLAVLAHKAARDVVASCGRTDGLTIARAFRQAVRAGPRGLSRYTRRGNPGGHEAIRWHVERLSQMLIGLAITQRER